MDIRSLLRSRAALLLGLVLLAVPAAAGFVRPVVGAGNFYFTCDVVTLARDDGGIDVVAMVAVPHRELTFQNEAGLMRARVRAIAAVVDAEGVRHETEVTKRLSARSEEEAGSPTLDQVFTVILNDVPVLFGTFELRLEDLNRRRPGFVHLGSDRKAFAMAVADWYAPPAREAYGLAVSSPIFLAQASIREWAASGRMASVDGDGPWDYLNPRRRYGLEAEALQFYITVEPPVLAEDRRRASSRDLRLEIASEHLDFALRDTIVLSRPVREALAAGRPAAIYWEMDASGLPPGSFRMGIAPLDTAGRGVLSGFDMVWQLTRIARHTDDLLGEGRTVLLGDQLAAFDAAPRVEQEEMLAAFWHDLDPTPEDPYNEAYAEFRRRAAVVTNFYGGFSEMGPVDPRGRIFMLLGEPSSIRRESLPMNEDDLNDARILVFERYAAERLGSTAKAGSAVPVGQTGIYRRSYHGDGVIPLPYSYLADQNIKRKVNSPDSRVFELWRYEDGGDQIFPNSYTGQGQGLRFLFLDKTGAGDFVLDSDNTRFIGD
jgi:GWxTD domain-containing protein